VSIEQRLGDGQLRRGPQTWLRGNGEKDVYAWGEQ
jgi:hypothetical protein